MSTKHGGPPGTRGAGEPGGAGAGTSTPPLFRLSGVCQVKAGAAILDHVDLEIPGRMVSALVGPSGAGKTSLLRLLNRLDDPVRGEICFRSQPIVGYPVRKLRRTVGFVFQTPVLFPGSVHDNLRAAAGLGGDAANDLEARMREAMELAELEWGLGGRKGDHLSVGQKQRVNVARALMTRPDVLLMDEPTSALDPDTSNRLMKTIGRLSMDRGLTVVMATHRLEEARSASDVTIVVDAGRVVEVGPTPELFERATHPGARAFLTRGR